MTEGEAFMGGVGWAGVTTLGINFAIIAVAHDTLDETWMWCVIESVLAVLLLTRPALVLFGLMEGRRLFDSKHIIKSQVKGRLMGMVLGFLGVGWGWLLAR